MAAALPLMAVQAFTGLKQPEQPHQWFFIWLDMDYKNDFVNKNGSNKKNLMKVSKNAA